MTNESRRSFLMTAVALWQAASIRAQQQKQRGRFLNPQQHEVLLRLMDKLIPADERSGGAVGAKVDEYIDFVLLHADPPLQAAWRNGLDSYGRATDLDTFLNKQARAEFSPATEDERFFVLLKAAVTEGFYTSEEGISKELGYQGMTFDMDPSGCTHADHKAPAGYKPLLRSAEKA
jgi:hypothetical protein